MPGTTEGGRKCHAAAIGISYADYTAHLDAGERWCRGCAEWHPAGAFAGDRSRVDGVTSACREWRNKWARQHYTLKGPPDRYGPPPAAQRDDDRRQARGRVNNLVDHGKLPDPNTLPCTDCGHIWRPGERRHEYDHYHGYGNGHHEDVQAVCTRCHAKRTWTLREGEARRHRRNRGRTH
jgi:hypothetical protein